MSESENPREDTPPPSTLLAGFGAVQPRSRPENDATIRKEFENGVAEEVIAETQRSTKT